MQQSQKQTYTHIFDIGVDGSIRLALVSHCAVIRADLMSEGYIIDVIEEPKCKNGVIKLKFFNGEVLHNGLTPSHAKFKVAIISYDAERPVLVVIPTNHSICWDDLCEEWPVFIQPVVTPRIHRRENYLIYSRDQRCFLRFTN
jgi:hypothetical protein